MTTPRFIGQMNSTRGDKGLLRWNTEGMHMFGRRSPATSQAEEPVPAASGAEEPVEPRRELLDVVHPMQTVRVRWHTLNGGEVTLPGQVQSVDGEMIDVWFDRHAPGYDPLRTQMDEHIWIDAFSGADTYVFAGWLIGIRSPDTLVVMAKGAPRRDQRRQHVRELVELPAQTVFPVDADGEPIGDRQLVKIHDLSGGGVKMELHRDVAKNDLLLLNLELGEVSFDAIVCVVDAFRTVRGRQFVRCAFVEIEERYRREVIRFVFREQLRKSRMLSA